MTAGSAVRSPENGPSSSAEARNPGGGVTMLLLSPLSCRHCTSPGEKGKQEMHWKGRIGWFRVRSFIPYLPLNPRRTSSRLDTLKHFDMRTTQVHVIYSFLAVGHLCCMVHSHIEYIAQSFPGTKGRRFFGNKIVCRQWPHCNASVFVA